MGERGTAGWVATGLLAPLLLLSLVGEARGQQRQVTAAAVRDWPPYYVTNAEGLPTGFAVETMDAVASRAGLSVEYRVFDDFPSARAALRAGDVDLIPNYGITEGREEEFEFTSPLEVFDLALFVRSDGSSIDGLEDLAGRPVAVVEGNVGVQIVADYPDVRPVLHHDVRTALYELLSGRVDALIHPRPVLLSLARQAEVDGQIRPVGPSLGEVKRAIAVRRGDALLARLEPAVNDLAGSEEYADIYGRWFTPPPPYWTAERVAIAAGATALLGLLVFLLLRERWYRRITAAVLGRERAEEEQKVTEGRYRRLLEQASDGIFIADSDRRYIEVNRRACEMTGYSREELLQMRLEDLPAPADVERQPIQVDALRVGLTLLRERTFQRKDGSTFPVEISATMLEDGSLQGIVRDISERVEAEEAIRERDEQLQQSQKMEAIGRLAGGVAHDFNNLLTVILGNGETLGRALDDEERELLDEMMEAGARAAGLTRQLLAFSRKQVVRIEPLDVTEVLSDLHRMLERIIGEDIALTVEAGESPCVVVAGRAQLEQVLLNLAVNARDAMPHGGELVIRCRGEEGAGEDPGRVVLEVSDTGQGMDADTRAHAFEPFFTTKETGRGTGLGLATVHSIVEQLGGTIALDSAPDAGARFVIELPRHRGAASEAPATREPPRATRRRRVLVVEDEQGVLRLVRRVLERAGYDVTTAERADDALAQHGDEEPFDLLVTDIVMPGMGGVELAEELTERWPRLCVLFMSGYPQRSLDSALSPAGRAFLAKPFTHDQLLEHVVSVLDEA